jgi:hypothetical protein
MALTLGYLVGVTAMTPAGPLRAQDRLDGLLAQYQHEADPVRKARVLAKLGDDQVAQARDQLKSGADVDSLQTLATYRDEIRETVTALEAAVPDAEKKPAGFKELQISMRETVRHIDDLILTLPVDKRPFFREVRDDLVKTQNELIDALFPRRPNQIPKKPTP